MQPEPLRAHQGERLHVIEVGEDKKRDPDRCARCEARALRSIPADWVLFLDADEFWTPASGPLQDGAHWRDAAIEGVQVPRYDVAQRTDGPRMPATMAPDPHDQWRLFARATARFQRPLRETPGTPGISGMPVPGIAARPAVIGLVDGGWLRVRSPDGCPLRRVPGFEALQVSPTGDTPSD